MKQPGESMRRKGKMFQNHKHKRESLSLSDMKHNPRALFKYCNTKNIHKKTLPLMRRQVGGFTHSDHEIADTLLFFSTQYI